MIRVVEVKSKGPKPKLPKKQLFIIIEHQKMSVLFTQKYTYTPSFVFNCVRSAFYSSHLSLLMYVSQTAYATWINVSLEEPLWLNVLLVLFFFFFFFCCFSNIWIPVLLISCVIIAPTNSCWPAMLQTAQIEQNAHHSSFLRRRLNSVQ